MRYPILSPTIVVLGFCCATCSTFAQSCADPAPVYAETFQINKQVDTTRTVQKAVMTNTRSADHVLEFTAAIGETKERWTITYHNDPAYNLYQEVSVNGDWRYTIKYADAAGNPKMTLATPTLSAEIDVLNVCADTDRPMFAVIAAMIENDRVVVHEVLDAMPAQSTQVDPNCFVDCNNQWQATLCTNTSDCYGGFACCVGRKMFLYCIAVHCTCPNSDEEDCCDDAFQQLVGGLEGCFHQYIGCVTNGECD